MNVGGANQEAEAEAESGDEEELEREEDHQARGDENLPSSQPDALTASQEVAAFFYWLLQRPSNKGSREEEAIINAYDALQREGFDLASIEGINPKGWRIMNLLLGWLNRIRKGISKWIVKGKPHPTPCAHCVEREFVV